MSKTQWAIKSRCLGLYYGTYRTQREAIAHHVWAFDQTCFDNGPPKNLDRLDEDQKRAWRIRLKRGDRAVKVVVQVLDTKTAVKR